jgi:tetratricopeptide (TPR) repeat protein
MVSLDAIRWPLPSCSTGNIVISFHTKRLTYSALKEYQQALAMMSRYLELDTRNPLVYLDRSQCYNQLKEYQQSIKECNRALELAPKLAVAYWQRGYIYLWLKDIEQAHADFIRSCELEPAWIHRALMVEWVGMCREAIVPNGAGRLEAIAATDLESSSAGMQSYPIRIPSYSPRMQSYTAHTCRGITLLLRRQLKEALAELEQALLLYPNRWDASFWEGMTSAFLEQDEEAIAAIEKALALEMPPILLKPLSWFEQERPELYEKFVKPLLATYEV